MPKIKFVFILALFFAAACGGGADRDADVPSKNTSNSAANTYSATNTSDEIPEAAVGRATPDKSAATTECQQVKTGDKVVLKSQTFAIDFEPFRGSCFVTAHNPEFKEPPMESEMAIYKDGKKVFDFPGQFNGATFGCWVDAVSFQDVNGDTLTDVIVIGKCSGKSDTYNENMVYLNTGKAFTTNQDANYRISELEKVKQVSDFAKDHREIFAK